MSEETANAAPETTQAAEAQTTEQATENKQESLFETTEKQETDASSADGSQSTETEQKTAAEVKYELKLPEGSPLAAEKVEEVVAFAKERGLSNEQAQAVLERESKAVSAFAETQKTQVIESNKKWFEELKSNKDFGGEKLSETGQLAFRAGKELFGEGFMQILKEANLNHYPPLVLGLAKYGKMISNDTFVHSSAPAKSEKSAQEIFYPQYYDKE